MVQPVKFAFDTPFASARGGRRARDTFDAKELEQAKAAAYAEGLAVGSATEKASTARREAEALERIAACLRDIGAARSDTHRAAIGDGSRLALGVARRFVGAILARDAAAEVESLLRQCLETLHGEPRIVLRVAPDVYDVLGPRIDGLAPAIGFEGKIVLVGDPSMTGSACRVEWADGGAERNDSLAWMAIDAAIDRLAPPSEPASSEPPPPHPVAEGTP